MQNFHRDGVCPVRDVLCRLGDKWTTLVLVTLHAKRTACSSEKFMLRYLPR